ALGRASFGGGGASRWGRAQGLPLALPPFTLKATGGLHVGARVDHGLLPQPLDRGFPVGDGLALVGDVPPFELAHPDPAGLFDRGPLLVPLRTLLRRAVALLALCPP